MRALALFDTPPAGGPFRGRPFHNAAVQAAEAMPEIRKIVRTHKRRRISGLTKLGKVGADDPKLLGKQFAVIDEGAAASATSLND